jgi:hypothetical protein
MLAYAIDNTSKTRALFEINKGSNKRPEIHVNSALPHELRRVPFSNMIYVADGPSDVPAWSVVRNEGGRTLGVYQRGSLQQFEQINALQRDGRIHAFAEADYSEQSTAWLWLTSEVRRMANRIIEDREAALHRALRPPARHLAEDLPAEAAAETERQEVAEEAAPPRPMPARTRADEIRDSVRASLDDDAEADQKADVTPPKSARRG